MIVFKQFVILLMLGSTGIVLLTIDSIPLARQQLAALPADAVAALPPLWVILLLQGLQSAVLVAAASLIGIFCTRAVGLHSHLIDAWALHRAEAASFKLATWGTELKWSLGIGAATTIVILIIDRLLQPLLPAALQAANQTEPNWLTSLAGVFYGGVTEEILMRWGLMSLLVWVAWKLFRQGVTLPSQWIYRLAIVLSALVFGLGHLPATAAITPLTSWVILRAVVLNGIAGIAYGWLFWHYSLEAAIIAHASLHVITFIVTIFVKGMS
jgi:membrane protease YdiL (CAAX protease family)